MLIKNHVLSTTIDGATSYLCAANGKFLEYSRNPFDALKFSTEQDADRYADALGELAAGLEVVGLPKLDAKPQAIEPLHPVLGPMVHAAIAYQDALKARDAAQATRAVLEEQCLLARATENDTLQRVVTTRRMYLEASAAVTA